MSVIWSLVAALFAARIYRDRCVGLVVGLLVFSHWVLDFISHPIPFSSFSWRSWQWSYGHPLPSDLPLLFGASPKVGLGLYNSISAVEAAANSRTKVRLLRSHRSHRRFTERHTLSYQRDHPDLPGNRVMIVKLEDDAHHQEQTCEHNSRPDGLVSV
jgi:hypothetical protein